MSDDLERRLGEAFHRGSLPPAPPSLVAGLQRVADAPVSARSARFGRTGFGLLAAAIILIAAGAIAVVGGSTQRPAQVVLPPATPAPSPAISPPVAGGLRLGFVAQPVAGVTPTAADMTDIVSVLKARAAAAGIVGATFTIQGPDTVIVELPGVTESEPVAMLLGHTGDVAFVPLGADSATQGDVLDPGTLPPLLSGDAIASAAVGTDQNGGSTIDLVLTAAGARSFGDYTAANVGSSFAITMDGIVLTAPVIQSEIRDGQVQITGGGTSGFDQEHAAAFVAILDSGALPFPLRLTSSPVTVGPSPSGP